MDEELKSLKSVLRSLVVSSSIQVDVYSLQKDYRSMMGRNIPVVKYGYKDILSFLKERCSDCFLFNGSPSNPVLTLIVPDNLKHIDNFVQKQKVSSGIKYKGKRRSVSASVINPPQHNLITNTFYKKVNSSTEKQNPMNGSQSIVKPPAIETSKTTPQLNGHDKENDKCTMNGQYSVTEGSALKENNIRGSNSNCSSKALQNFLKKRSPFYNSAINVADDKHSEDRGSSKDDDSGRLTSSSTSSSKLTKLEELKTEIQDLVTEHPDGIWCTDLIRLYRERYGREMNYSRFGYTSIVSLASDCSGLLSSWAPDADDWRLRRALPAPAARPPVRPACPVRAARPPRPSRPTQPDPDDALPGIDFDPDVFPSDCMHFMESIPAQSLSELEAGAMLEVIVGEVYSPSHLWLIRLGERYDIAMEEIMDEMTAYYSSGAGRDRVLSRGAARVGHYCSSVYEQDWHRSLIVQILDSDTVKVRHVDYGTVDTVPVAALKPLRRCWAALPAQAIRARLAGVRPSAGGRRWPHAAAQHFLHLVRDRRLVAHLAAIDREEEIMEVFLIDTSKEDDVCIGTELVRSGHADSRPDSAVKTSEWHLYPRFEALESGATPNYAEIHRYLRDGIALDYVDAYRRHVPSVLPAVLPRPPSPPPSSPPTPTPIVTRVPLLLANAKRSPSPGRSESPPAYSPSIPLPPAVSLAAPPSQIHAAPPPHIHAAPSPQINAAAPPHIHAAPPPQIHAAVPPPALRPSATAQWPRQSPLMAGTPGYFHPPCQSFTPVFPMRFGTPVQPPAGEVRLSVGECEMYRMLSRMDPNAAHWYMVEAISRAMAASCGAPVFSTLNPAAPEFPGPSPPPGLARMHMPPGFG